MSSVQKTNILKTPFTINKVLKLIFKQSVTGKSSWYTIHEIYVCYEVEINLYCKLQLSQFLCYNKHY